MKHNVVNDYEVGRINLSKLYAKIDDYIARNKDLQGAELYPIKSSFIDFTEREIMEKELNYIVSSVDSEVERTVNRFVDKLKKLSE